MKKIVGIFVVLILLGVSPTLAYTQINLVSDIAGLAKFTDPNLVNSWGIAHSPNGPWFVSDNGPGLATLYKRDGIPFPKGNPLKISIPGINGASGTPTGIVFNGGSDFDITPGNPATFIFATEDGIIAAWNPEVDRFNAIQMVNNSPGSVYKGLTIASNGGKNFLYVANFRQGKVDVFDTNFNKVSSFTDPLVPIDFAPFNVMNIEGNLVVTFAKQDALKHDDVAGPGNGFVDIFDPAGNILLRFQHGPWLNSPWGITKAPSNFGIVSGDLLIGQFGSGNITRYDTNGHFLGFLLNNSNPITIDGLWGLGFGNDVNAGPSNTLFFAAGINDEGDGLFGMITK